MRILHIHPSMSQGGIEAMISGLANEMSKDNDVSVCSIFAPTEASLFWGKLCESVNKFDLGKTSKGFSLIEIIKIYKAIKHGKYDVVNIHGFFYYYAFSVLLLHKRVKFFYTVHSDAVMENSPWDKLIFRFKRFCFKHRWVRPITISEPSKDSFTKLYSCHSNLIPNGVLRPLIAGTHNVIDDLRITKDTRVFLHPGRITKAKNQVVLVRAFDRLLKEGKDVVLLIVGSNDDDVIFQDIMPYFSDRIRYEGPRSDIPELFAKADAFCLPSIWEGMPVTLLEALSVGCIPICSPVGGIVKVIKSGVNGLLSKSSSEGDYYEALNNFLSKSQEEISEMKTKCLESFLPYDIKLTASSYLELYKR